MLHVYMLLESFLYLYTHLTNGMEHNFTIFFNLKDGRFGGPFLRNTKIPIQVQFSEDCVS